MGIPSSPPINITRFGARSKLMGTDKLPRGIGPRTGVFLRARYPRDRAKLIAGQFRVSVSTAQRWLDGTAPTTEHLEAMFALWGADFLQAVFAEAFTAGTSEKTIAALLDARTSLLHQLGAPADPLIKARQLQELDFRWRWIWAPSPKPRMEYSARRIGPPSSQKPALPVVHARQVADLLVELTQTVQPETALQRLLQRFWRGPATTE